MAEAVHFQMEVARISFAVNCLYPSTKAYCSAYLREGEGSDRETITITSQDIEAERVRLLRKKDPGQPLEASTPQSLEVLVLCRRIADLLPKYDRILFHGSTLSVDGRGMTDLQNGDRVVVRKSGFKLLMAHLGLKSFYEIAFEKLSRHC